jgi:DNA-binding NarL/FixJ family response regulator
VRVLVVDDNPVVLRGMQSLLGDVDDVEQVLLADNGVTALEMLRSHDVDVMCLDVRMPLMDGLEVVAQVAHELPVVMLTHSEEPEVIGKALAAGARGYLVHGTFGVDEVMSALRTCLRGGLVLGATAADVVLRRAERAGEAPPAQAGQGGLAGDLTEREREIVLGVTRGLSNAAIGRELFLSEKTVKNHLNRIYAKVAVHSRTELVAAWFGTGHGPSGPGGSGPSVGP